VKGWVYFARLAADGPIKIGHALNPRRRVSTLSSLSPHVITLLAAMPCDDAVAEEQRLHEKLAIARIKGAWFDAGPVLEEMQTLAERMVSLEHLPTVSAPTNQNAQVSLTKADTAGFGVDVFAAVLDRFRDLLGDARGKICASDALLLAGFSSPRYRKQQFVARALRELGWERSRSRYGGGLLYAYARGTQLEREVMLDVERGDDDRLVVKRREP
jgi:hypothetical protein